MISNTPTVHNSAKYGDIASTVLMPGDPKRAKYIADNFLENAECFNELRGMLGFTGLYKGKRISVMGSGMGMPSMGIYSYELYKFYGVERIIRIGSCGTYTDELNLLDTFLIDKCYSEGNFALTYRNSEDHIISASSDLNDKIKEKADKLGIDLKIGNACTSECFDPYIDVDKFIKRIPPELDCKVAEMEAYALFNVAQSMNKQAACILSVSDSLTKKQSIDSNLRQNSLNNMIKIALEAAID